MLKIHYTEIILLTIFFTVLAKYMNVYEENKVYNFLITHLIALILSLLLAKGIYEYTRKRY
jgi:hypothetical protein